MVDVRVKTKWSKKLKSVGITFHPDVLKKIDRQAKVVKESRGSFVNRHMAVMLNVELK
jgi:hypothetical protein